jgi:NTP pyrophosphatase (non-canonical NTP hydrolase)
MTEENDLVIITENQSKEYTTLKLLEEMAELSEVLLKTLTKKQEEHIPKKEKVIEELGDVMAWCVLYITHFDIIDGVDLRVMEKIELLKMSTQKRIIKTEIED